MAKIDSAYDYYMATYANREVSRYDSHKKSDLRKVYNKIVKTNKESPLYKISNVQDAAKYAIDIKEHAKSIQNVVSSLSDQYGSFENSFQKKVAQSSSDEDVSVKYVGDGHEENQTDHFTIEVDQLATPQTNTGNYLKNTGNALLPGSYSFELDTNNSSYEFQFNVQSEENNLDIVNEPSKLVNNSNLGIRAEVLAGEEGTSALLLASKQTGLSANEENLFSIQPATNMDSIRAMDVLGINQISQPARNSSFRLNGTEHSSLSNTFTINNAFELTLKNAGASEPIQIGFKANTDAVADNIQTLIDAYNQMLDSAKGYAKNSTSADGNRLYNELSSSSRNRRLELGDIGLLVDEEGIVSIDREKLAEAIEPERAEETFHILNRFKESVGGKADNASVNPMQFVNKVVVAYKNPGHNFHTPYISSIYSGMMLDNYI